MPKAEGHTYCLECAAKVNHRWYTRHIREKRAYNKGYLAGRRSAAASAPKRASFRIIVQQLGE